MGSEERIDSSKFPPTTINICAPKAENSVCRMEFTFPDGEVYAVELTRLRAVGVGTNILQSVLAYGLPKGVDPLSCRAEKDGISLYIPHNIQDLLDDEFTQEELGL